MTLIRSCLPALHSDIEVNIDHPHLPFRNIFGNRCLVCDCFLVTTGNDSFVTVCYAPISGFLHSSRKRSFFPLPFILNEVLTPEILTNGSVLDQGVSFLSLRSQYPPSTTFWSKFDALSTSNSSLAARSNTLPQQSIGHDRRRTRRHRRQDRRPTRRQFVMTSLSHRSCASIKNHLPRQDPLF